MVIGGLGREYVTACCWGGSIFCSEMLYNMGGGGFVKGEYSASSLCVLYLVMVFNKRKQD